MFYIKTTYYITYRFIFPAFQSESTISQESYIVSKTSSFNIICLTNITYSTNNVANLSCPENVSYSSIVQNIPLGESFSNCVQSVSYTQTIINVTLANGGVEGISCLNNITLIKLSATITGGTVYNFVMLNISVPRSFDHAIKGVLCAWHVICSHRFVVGNFFYQFLFQELGWPENKK